MTEAPASPETPQSADARADRLTFIWVAGFFIAFLVVDILSSMTEMARHQLAAEPAKVAIYEISSVFVILVLYWAIARAVTLATPGQHGWRYVLAVHAAAIVVFSAVHICAMVALRKLAFMIAYGYPYIFTDNPVREFTYEFRKDALTYVLIAFFITFGRQLAQQRREIAAAREDAKKTHRLTLKCGGRSVFVDADKVIWVKSASNYVELNAGADTHLTVTTQAAERAYRAQPGEIGRVRNRLVVEPGAALDWLPQETILFDGAALDRRLSADLQGDARLLLVEPVVFGRHAMGEVLRSGRFADRIDIRRDGALVFADRTALSGDIAAHLERPAVAGGAGAMATVLLACPEADRRLDAARETLPATGGASLIREGLLFARLLAPDGFTLRKHLLPLIASLSITPLPRTWTI